MSLDAPSIIENRPSSNVELFSDENLANPYDVYAELRTTAPAVYLEAYDIWFIGRYQTLKESLDNWEAFSSHLAVGFNKFFNEALADALINCDPPEHGPRRKLFVDQMSVKAMREIQETIDARALDLGERIAATSGFDGVTDVAHDLPINVVMELVGWPDDERDDVLQNAIGFFNALGPEENPRMLDGLTYLQRLAEMATRLVVEDKLKPSGFGYNIVQATKTGDLPQEVGIALVAGYAAAAFDTTINGIGNSLFCFAKHPEQWDLLREDPKLVVKAFNEVLRYESPVQHMARKTTREVDFGHGTVIPAGERILMSFGSGNRDDSVFEKADRFDITRKMLPNFGFGGGPHACAGQNLARLEGAAILRGLTAKISRLEITGEPESELNNITRGFRHLPMQAKPV